MLCSVRQRGSIVGDGACWRLGSALERPWKWWGLLAVGVLPAPILAGVWWKAARGLAPAGDLLSCSCKQVGNEARPASPARRAEGSSASRPFARRKAKQLALRNPALTPRCEGPPGRSLNQPAAMRPSSDNATGRPPANLPHSAGQRGRQTVAGGEACRKQIRS